MSRNLILGTLIVLAWAGSAGAQVAAQPAGPPLTLRAAEEEALARNPELIALRRQFDAAAAAPAQERFLEAPMLEAQIWGWPVTTLNPARTDMYMFMAEQAFPGRGKREARVLVGERDADIERHRVLVRANAVLDDVRQAYTDVALGRATAALFDQQAAVLRDIADAATIRYAAGHAGQHDTVQSVVELARLEGERIEWRGRTREAEARLNTVLGRIANAPVEPVATMAAREIPDDLAQAVLDRHPVIAMARAEAAREEAELARLRGERRPDYVVGGGYMAQPGEAGAWTARVGLSWPNAPWSRKRLDAAIEAQDRRVEAARARIDAEVNVIRRDLQEAIVRAETARERLRLIESTVIPHVEHALDVTRVAYSTNRGEFIDVIDTQRVLLSVRLEAIAAQADFDRAHSALERAIGAMPLDTARPSTTPGATLSPSKGRDAASRVERVEEQP